MRLTTKIRQRDHIKIVYLATKSPHPRRRSTPIRTPPVDPFPQHRKLRRGQAHCPILGIWPRKTAPFEHFVIEAKSLPIPEQKFDPITPMASRRKHRPTCWLLPQDILIQRRQPRDPLAHIRHAAGQIHTHTGARADHAASTTRKGHHSTSAKSGTGIEKRPRAMRGQVVPYHKESLKLWVNGRRLGEPVQPLSAVLNRPRPYGKSGFKTS